MSLAAEHGIRTIAFPSISTGVYRYPVHLASRIAVQTILDSLQQPSCVEKVVIACFEQRVYDAYRDAVGPGGTVDELR
jgi:O-acetyl-ADP-ribose deacetylase (regulator of RNase III)